MVTYCCPHCDKKYDVYSSMYSHIATRHKDPKVTCTKCSQLFHTHSQLYKHAYHKHPVEVTPRAPLETTRAPLETKRNTLSSRLFELG